MSGYVVDVWIVCEKIYVSHFKCWCSSWYQLQIYL